MTWAKIDDRANEHHKQLAAGPEACWLWVCGLMYANRQPSRNGLIPNSALRMLYPFENVEALAHRLVSARLWKKTKDGFRIHEFEKWNETAEQREARLAASKERAAKSYAKKKLAAEKSARAEEAQNRKSARAEEAQNSDSSGSLPLPASSTPKDQQLLPDRESTAPVGGKISCPKDLALTADQRATLEGSLIPGWAIDQITLKFVSRYLADPGDLRTLIHWQKGLSIAVCGDWNNPVVRPKKPEIQPVDDTDGYGKASDWQ